MTCPQCQLPNPVGTSYCARCGAPLQATGPRPPMGGMVAGAGESKGMAITALVLGILSPLLACVGVGFLTAIVAVIPAMAGIWGMNFKFMPDLDWRYGYPAALGTMAIACGFLYHRFKVARWL